jgi:hypothetical protein
MQWPLALPELHALATVSIRVVTMILLPLLFSGTLDWIASHARAVQTSSMTMRYLV